MKNLTIKDTASSKKLWAKLIFLATGIAASIWFLIRVIPKPSRATYPCMKAAAPFMSSFVFYLISIGGSAFFLKKFNQKYKNANYISASAFFFVFVAMLLITDASKNKTANAINLVDAKSFEINSPIGEAKGYAPGRVVWVWNKDATDENLTPANSTSNWWANYTNPDVVDEMLYDALTSYTNSANLSEAWGKVFTHFNSSHGKGAVSYKPGEKIYIKINVTNSCCSVSGTKKTKDYNRMDSTPEVMLALLRQLIEEVGVAQEDIYLGDPFRTFHDLYWDVCHSVYPNVVYCDGKGQNGRHQTSATNEVKMLFSDGKLEYKLPQEYYDADYFINLPCLKSHDTGGITIGAKNHQGSILHPNDPVTSQSAMLMHYAFPQHDAKEGGTHRYRHLVDYLGHERLGGNTLITIVDGIWAGRSWEGFVEKWQMEPFNGDYPSSILISQDLVAIDAVCFDFLLEEYKNKSSNQKYPYMAGTDDYLLQAASPANWAEGVVYDPEGDGTPIASLGVYEHWNNPTDKEYSRNLGSGNGIELVKVFTSTIANTLTTENSKLPSNEIKSIFIDNNDVAWIGTNAGLVRHDGLNWETISKENYLKNNTVNDIAYEKTDKGDLLLVATNEGLTILNFDSKGVTEAATFNEANSDLVGNIVSNVMVDSKQNHWIGTEKAINVLRNGKWAHEIEGVDAMGDFFNYTDFPITDITEYKPKTFAFIATKGKGIVRSTYNDVDGFTGASTMGQPWASINSNEINATDTDGEIQWYGTSKGINYHSSWFTKEEWEGYTKESHKLLSDNITAIHIDKEKNIWIGTALGLNIIKADGAFNKHTEEYGLLNNAINVITSDSKGNVWVGTSGGVEWFETVPGVDISTSINITLLEKRIKAYPNPANDFINLEINIEKPQLVNVSIYNMKGQLIDVPVEKKMKSNYSKFTLDVKNRVYYQPGIYIIRIECKEFVQFEKIQII